VSQRGRHSGARSGGNLSHLFRVCLGVPCQRMSQESVGRDDELGVGIATHAVNGAGRTSAHGIRVATWMLGGDGDGTIGAAHDGAIVIEWIRTAEVDDEASVLRTAHKSDRGSDFDTESFVGLGVGNARGSGGVRALVALDVDGARRRGGTASVGRGTNAGRIRNRANVAFDFLLGVAASDEVGQQKRQHEQTTESYKIAISLH
jgi:hypothetical protein